MFVAVGVLVGVLVGVAVAVDVLVGVFVGVLVGVLVAMGMRGVMPGLSNVVERTVTVEELAGTIQKVYPDLELVYVNQDTRLRNLLVEPDARLAELGLLEIL